MRESYGKGVAFLPGWISLIVGFSTPIAAAAIAFATHCFRVLPGSPISEFRASVLDVNIFDLSLITVPAADPARHRGRHGKQAFKRKRKVHGPVTYRTFSGGQVL